MSGKAGLGRFSGEFVAGYDDLYSKLRPTLENGLSLVGTALLAILSDDCISVSQRMRMRVETGRVKSRDRLLAKAGLPRYEDRIVEPSDVFKVITDICGTRVTCNTVQDVRRVTELILQSQSLSLPEGRSLAECIDDYIESPKTSGYRGLHILLSVRAPRGMQLVEVVCEVQIRTLLQNAWGELTHEDTFKPEMEVPELVHKLSTRMATTLAVLDEIAQDLRDELDRISALDEESDGTSGHEGGIEQRTVEEAFERVFGRQLVASPENWTYLRSLLLKSRLEDDVVEERLAQVRRADREIGSNTPVPLQDWELTAIAVSLDDDRPILDQLQMYVQRAQRSLHEREKFLEEYVPGSELLGTVLRVSRSYAVLALAGGARGILSRRTLPVSIGQRSLERYLRSGDTVRAKIVSSDGDTRRIEIVPLEPLRERDDP